MKKYRMAIVILFLVLIACSFTSTVYAIEIPEKLEDVSYFLQSINTPFWIWFFRIGFCVCLLGILLSYFYYKNKKD